MTRKRAIPLILAVNGLIAFLAVVAWQLLPRTYESAFVLAVPASSNGLNTSIGNVTLNQEQGGFTGQVDPRMVQKQILLSDAVFAKLGNKDVFPRGRVKVKPEEMSGLLTVVISDPTAEGANRRANRLIDAYRKRVDELRRSDYRERENLYGKLLKAAAAELEHSEVELARFKARTGLVSSQEQVSTMLATVAALIRIQEETRAAQKEAEARVRTLSTRLSLSPTQAIESLKLSSYAPYVTARSQLDEAERSLTEARALYTDENPKVKDLLSRRIQLQALVKQRVAETVARSAKAADGSLDATRMDLIGQMVGAEAEAKAKANGVRALDTRIDRFEGSLQALGPAQVDLVRYQRRLQIAEVTYNALTSQTQQARLDVLVRYPNVQVLDGPSLALEPSSPKLVLVAGGAIGAGLLATLALLLRARSLDPPLFEADLPALGAPVLAHIPELQPTPAVHFYMLAALLPPEVKMLLITSSTAGEGKSFVSTHLAGVLASWDRRILLVDADFSKESSLRRLSAPAGETSEGGLTCIRADNLEQLKTIVNYASSTYDLVLVDTGPLQLTADAVSILKLVPDVLFVMRRGYVSRPLVESSLRFLGQARANLVGCVLNGARDLTGNGYSSYRRYLNNSLPSS